MSARGGAARITVRMCGALYRSLVATGCVWVPGFAIVRRPDDDPVLDAPPVSHPERLCPERPLTEGERKLLQELAG